MSSTGSESAHVCLSAVRAVSTAWVSDGCCKGLPRGIHQARSRPRGPGPGRADDRNRHAALRGHCRRAAPFRLLGVPAGGARGQGTVPLPSSRLGTGSGCLHSPPGARLLGSDPAQRTRDSSGRIHAVFTIATATGATVDGAPSDDSRGREYTGRPESPYVRVVFLERVATDRILDSHCARPVIPCLEADMGVRDG